MAVAVLTGVWPPVAAAVLPVRGMSVEAALIAACLLATFLAVGWLASRFDRRIPPGLAFAGASLGAIAGGLAGAAVLIWIDRARIFGNLSDRTLLAALAAITLACAMLGAFVIGRRLARRT